MIGTDGRRGLGLPVLAAMALALLILRMAVWATVEPMGDEAYYWVWGQHPGWSYYDHPPLQAWLQGLSTTLLGPGLLTLRMPTLLTLGVSFYLLWLFARRAAAEAPWPWFLASVIVLLGSPLFFIYTTIATHDHLLVALSLAALYPLARFFDGLDAGETRWRLLYLSAAAMGLACLTKYIGIVLPPGAALAILLRPGGWRLLRHWQLHLAWLIVLVLQAPVLIWNLETGFASFTLHLVDRQQGDAGWTWTHALSFVIQLVVLVGPFLLWPTAKLFYRAEPQERAGRFTWLVSTLGFFAVSLRTFVSGQWNIVGQAALLAPLTRTIGRGWMLAGHWLYGAIMGTLLLVNYTTSPVLGVDTLETYRAYGWREVASAFEEEVDKNGPGFLAASHYMLASQLNLALGRADITALSQRRDQYDYWFDDTQHLGQSALLLDDLHSPLEPAIANDFETVTEIRQVEIVQSGVPINTYRIYLCTGYRGADDPQRYQF